MIVDICAKGGNPVALVYFPQGNMSNTKHTQPAPSAASAWRKQTQQGELYTLPASGNVARLRRPPLMAMVAKAGDVPNPVSEQVIRLLAGTGTFGETDEAKRVAAYRNNSAAYMEIAKLCFVEPRVVDGDADYDNGEISTADLLDGDILFCVYTVAQGEAEELAKFRVNE